MTTHDLELLREECQRYQVLLESQLVDEIELSETDAAFVSSHQRSCTECGLYSTMLDAVHLFEPEANDDEMDTAMRELVGRSFDSRRARRRRIVTLAVAASFLLAAGLVLFTLVSNFGKRARFDLTHGTISMAGETITQGGHFHLGKEVAYPTGQNALIEIPGTLSMAIEKDARIRLIEAHSDRLRIGLDSGRMAVHLMPDGPLDLSVVLPSGEVEVVGTIFVVDAADSENRVEVIEGSVAIKYEKGAEKRRRLNAGWRFSLASESKTERTADREDPLLALLGVDGRTKRSTVADEAQPDELTEDEVVGNGRRRRAAASPKPTPEDLLVAARECRMSKDWACAVSRYRRVMALYPSRPDAATAMISAAQILLDKMRKPGAALSYFRRYQRRRPTGELGREALFGECSALKALHRTDEERRCLERYLETYPGTLYSKMATSRLNRLMEN